MPWCMRVGSIGGKKLVVEVRRSWELGVKVGGVESNDHFPALKLKIVLQSCETSLDLV